MPNQNSFQIVIIDTDPADRCLIAEEFAAFGDIETNVFVRGAAAICYLERNTPHLILLDLDLAGKLGDDILRDLKASPRIRAVPVVVFTRVTDRWRLRRARLRGANLLIPKPQSATEFRDAVRRIAYFWTGCAHRLPRPADTTRPKTG